MPFGQSRRGSVRRPLRARPGRSRRNRSGMLAFGPALVAEPTPGTVMASTYSKERARGAVLAQMSDAAARQRTRDQKDRMNPETGGAVTMNVKPLAGRILVRRLEEQEVKSGGIIIPDTAKEKPQQAEVVATGPGRLTDDGKRIALEVKAGDKILMGKYSGTEVRIDGSE